MENHEIKTLAEHIEKNVGVFLKDIETQKKAILAKASRDAMLQIRHARELSKEIVDRALRQAENYLKEVQEKN